jgi:hypothetical protein
MQTTRVHVHPLYAIFVLGTFFGLDLGTIQSFVVANTLADMYRGVDYTSGFWASALLWAVSFFIVGIVATSITGMVSRGIVTTFWSSLVAGFITFITSLVVLMGQLLNPHPYFEHSYDQLGNGMGLFLFFIVFFCLWLIVMVFGLGFGSAGAGLYRGMQKIALRFNSSEQLKK